MNSRENNEANQIKRTTSTESVGATYNRGAVAKNITNQIKKFNLKCKRSIKFL